MRAVPKTSGPAWRALDADRVPAARWLAGFYGKRYGALVTSGSAAIELALYHLGLLRGARVLLPHNCCHQVPAAVLRAGATPVLVDVDIDLVLTASRLAEVMDDSISAIIAVDQYGVPCRIGALREVVGHDVPIVEDAAQGWQLLAGGEQPGQAADIVVTSFGAGKPLGAGGGGGIFANDSSIETWTDTWSPGQRMRTRPAVPFALSVHALPYLTDAVERADVRVRKLWRKVPHLLRSLEDFGLNPWRPFEGDRPTWRYVPIRVEKGHRFHALRNAPEADALGVCASHPVPLSKIPMLRGNVASMMQPAPVTTWLLLDPEPALVDARRLERWARRGAP